MDKNFIIISILILTTSTVAVYFIFNFSQLQEEIQRLETKLKKELEKEPEVVPNIIVSNPEKGEEADLPLKIVGEARVFEGTVNLRLREKEGKVLVEDIVMAQAAEVGQFGFFEKHLMYPQPEGEEGILEVFQISAKDGSEIDKITIPLKFRQVESLMVKAFFANSKQDPQALNCDNVYPVERRVPKTEAVARLALKELLKGPTITEQKQGFFTNINSNVRIQKLVVENGVAKPDFSEDLEYHVGGSCRVAGIRSQIIETLKQFPTINDVVISINDRVEDILQP